jgi:RNA polymerase sigma-70 factor, ECF subfamily
MQIPARSRAGLGIVTMKQQEATRLLNRASHGEIAAAADLLPLVYAELRALAQAFFNDERESHTLEPTALVHEAYLRLVDSTSIEWKSRNQFFVIASKAMRNILVDHARARGSLKRGGDWQEVTLQAVEAQVRGSSMQPIDLVALHDALERLAKVDERKARLVELRYFAGLNETEAAEVIGIARSTASEEWRLARAWLHKELRDTAL